ncbi:hypothetical protein T12_12933, partial [Trichinella patagoniensis]
LSLLAPLVLPVGSHWILRTDSKRLHVLLCHESYVSFWLHHRRLGDRRWAGYTL